MLPIFINILQVVLVLVSLLIILLVLMQRPKNEGLGAAFGGGATDQLFGAQTTNVLQTITRWLGGIFFALTLVLSILYVKKGGGRSSVQEKLTAPTAIPALPTPPPADPGAVEKSALQTGGPDGKPPIEGKEDFKLEQAPPPPDGPFSAPGTPGALVSDAGTIPDKILPETPPSTPKSEPTPTPGNAPATPPAAAPGAEKTAPSTPPVPPPAENKPAESAPAPAPEPKPAEPAK